MIVSTVTGHGLKDPNRAIEIATQPTLIDSNETAVLNAIENLFIKSIKLIKDPPIQKVQFNDIAIQKYLPYSSGISPHKDHKKYISVIIIVTLSGKSKFYLCKNRDGRNAQVVDDTPGNIVILPATGFKMINNNFVRPIHFVSDITDGRLSIGLRQNIEL